MKGITACGLGALVYLPLLVLAELAGIPAGASNFVAFACAVGVALTSYLTSSAAAPSRRKFHMQPPAYRNRSA